MNPQSTPEPAQRAPTPGVVSLPDTTVPLASALPGNQLGVAAPVFGATDNSTATAVNTGALGMASTTPPGPELPPIDPRTQHKHRLRFALLGIVLVAGLLLVLTHSHSSGNTPLASNVDQEYPSQTVPLSGITSNNTDQLSTHANISINGRLNVNDALVLAPMVQPSNAVTGQLYYDAATNQLSYFNGKTFATIMTNTVGTVGNIGGLSGDINLGPGLSVAGSLLSNNGVLSLQGQTGNVTLTAGGGIAVNGTIIANTGVLSLGGQTGNISVGSGLSLLGSQLHSTGVLSISAGNNIVVTNDGSGNVTISALGGSGGSSGTTGSGTGGTFALWDGSGTVNTLTSSLLSQSGGSVIVAGTLAANSFSGNGSGLTNVNAAQLDGQVAGYYQNAGNLNAGTLNDNRLSSNVARYNQAVSNFTGTLQQSGNDVCDTSGNCVGTGGGGAIGGGGSASTIALFTGSGYTIGDSILSQDAGATTITVTGDLTVSGSITATAFTGNGANLTNVNAAQLEGNDSSYYTNAGNLSSGTLSDSRLSTNVAKYGDTTANFTGALQHNGSDVCDTSGNCTGVAGGAIGGSGTANQIALFTGSGYTIGNSILSQSSDASNVTIGGNVIATGTITAASFSGNGAAVTNVNAAQLEGYAASYYTNASNISSGTLNDARLSANAALYNNSTSNFTGTLQQNGNDVCTTSGNCTSVPGGSIGGGGTVGTIPVFVTGGYTIGDSILSQDAGATTVTIAGDLSVTGNISATSFSGDGSGLTNVNAAQLGGQGSSYYTNAGNLSSGTLNDSRLSANVTLQGNTFNGAGQLVQLTLGGLLPVLDGSNLTNVNAAQLNGQSASYYTNAGNLSSGTLSDSRLSTNVAQHNIDNNFTGALQQGGNDVCTTAGNCVGSGSSGAIGGSGTANTLAMFSGSGYTIADSLLSQDAGATTVTVAGSLNVTGTYLQHNGNEVCDTSGNCAGVGGGVTTTGGVANTFAIFTGSQSVGDSIMTQDAGATTVTISGDLSVSGNVSATNLSGNGAGITNVNAAQLGGQSGSYYQNANNLNAGTVNDSRLSANVAKYGDTTANFTGDLQHNGNSVCDTSGNCASVGGGVTTSGGTANSFTIFTGSQTIGNSILAQNAGATTVTISGDLSVTGNVSATTLTGNGSSVTNVNAAQLGGQSGSYYTNASNLSSGTLSDGRLSANVTLQGNSFNGIGQLVQLDATTGYLPVLNGSNLTNVNAAQLSGQTGSYYTNASNISSGTLSNSRLNSDVALTDSDANFTGALQQRGNDVCTTAGNCVGSGGSGSAIGGSGTANQIALFTAAGTIGDSLLSQDAGATTVTIAGALTATGNITTTGDVSGGTLYQNGNQVCDTSGNCAGVGGGVTTAGGTANMFAIFTGSQAIGNSILSQNTDATTVSIAGDFSVSGNISTATGTVTAANFSGNGSAVTDVNAAELSGQAASYYTDASNISSGTLSDARLSTNAALYNNTTSNFTGVLQQAGNNVCTTAGNCAGNGNGGGLTGTGSVNYLTKFDAAGNLQQSLIYDSGTNVGIGTSSPTATLDVAAASNAATIRIEGNSSSAGSGISLLDNLTAGNTYTSFLNPSGTGGANLNTIPLSATFSTGGGTTGGIYFVSKAANAPIVFATGGSALSNERMVISGTGNIGLGTTAPAYLLDAGGDINTSGVYRVGGTAGLSSLTCSSGQFLQNQVVQGGIVTGGTCATGGITTIGSLDGGTANSSGATISGTTLYLQSASSSYAGLINTGSQTFNGSKTFSALTKFSSGIDIGSSQKISGSGSGNFDFINSGGGGWYFDWIQNGSTAMKLDTSNNLLIGTTTDSGSNYKLQAAGDAYVSGHINAVAGYQANGTAGLSSLTCSSGQFLQNQVVQGGIVTGGTCVTPATGIGGSGTANTIALFTASGTIGNSLLTQDSGSNTITVSGNLTATGTITATTFSGDGSSITNVNAAKLGGQTGSYYTDAGNISSGTLSDSRLTTNVALYNNATSNFAGALQQNGNNVCTVAGNCVGVSGGAIGGSGTSGTIAMFNGSGYTIADSILTQSGTTVAVGGTLQATTLNASTVQTDGTARIDVSGNLLSIGSYSGSGNITTTAGVLSIQGTGSNYFAGSVGIGTASPAYSLTIKTNPSYAGVIGISSNATYGAGPILLLQDYSGSTTYKLYTDNSGTLTLKSSNDTTLLSGTSTAISIPHLMITGAGGLSAPSLTIDPTNGHEAGFYLPAADSIGIITNRTERARIDASGNFGIGTTAPGYRIDVQGGDINTSGVYRAGGTAGVTTTCSGGQFLQNQVVQGGITTGGTCATSGTIGGSGTSGSIAMFTNDGYSVGNSILSQSGDTLTVSGSAATISSAANQGLTIQAPGTGALTLASGSGTISTTSDITALALNATGYKTTDTGTSYAGQWTLLGTCPLPAQLLGCHAEASLVNVGTNQGVTQRATLDIRVVQQGPLGSAPAVNLTLLNASGISSSDVTAVTAQNDASGTIVQIWGRLNSSDVTWAIAPLLNAGGVSFGWLQDQGFQATTPTAPTAPAQYADNMANSLSINDMLVLDNTGRLQTGALYGEYDGALTLANASNIYYGSGTNLTDLNAGNISNGILSVNHGGTGTNSIGPGGSIAYSDGSSLAFSSVGNIGQCLQSAGSNLPTWADCSDGATSVGPLDSGIITQDGGYITSGVLYLQSASPSHAGLVNAGVQSFAGAKTFTGATTIASTSSNAFQVQDADANDVLKVDTASGFVGVGSSSPQTLLDVGVSQGGTYPATAHAGTYSCDSGDSLSGTTCTHSTTYAGTYSAAYYYCPSGGSLDGTHCDTGTYAASYQSGYYYCPNGGSLSGTTCSYSATATNTCTGETINGDCWHGDGYWPNCNSPGDSEDTINGTQYCVKDSGVSAYSYSCPNGGSLSGTTCSYSASYASGYYYCASGGSLSGTTCTSYYNASYQAAYYSCNAGDSLSGSTCTHSTTYSATQGPTTYSCTPPDVLSGTTCTTTNTVSALIEGMVGIGTGSITPLSYTQPAIAPSALSFGAYVGSNDSCAAYSSAMSDFNGDGIPDIAYSCASSAIYVALGTSSGGFGSSTVYTTSLSTTYSVAIGDFNGDGKLDIAAASYGNSTVEIFSGNGDGTFNTTPTSLTVGFNPWSITTGDFNGDGKLDFAVSNGSSSTTLGVFINNGTGTAFTQTNITTNYAMTSGGTGDIAAADVNGDGKLDILAISYNSYMLMVLTNSGTGTSYTEADYTTQTYPYDIAVSDFNGDGKPDVAVPNYNSSTISTYLNNGSGGFSVQPTFSSNYGSPSSVAIGDFNGDGKQDMVVGNVSSASFSLFLGNGDGTFGALTTYSSGYSYPQTMNVVDMNGDGKPDIVTPSRNSAAISAFLNTTTFPVAASTHSATLGIQTESPSASGITVQGSAGQTGDLLHIQDANSTALLSVSANSKYASLTVAGAQGTTASHPLQAGQPPSSSTSTTSGYNWGYKFTPNSNGKITQLGAACTNGAATVTLYNASGTILATASVTASTTYNDWHYANITPISVYSGTVYYVAVHSTSGYYCYTSYTTPVTSGGITINSAAYSSSNGFPATTSTSTMYGYADITFVGSGAAAVFQGNVGIGITNPKNALSVSGNIAATGTITGGVASPDYAENIGVSDPSIGAADVVAMDPSNPGSVMKASKPYDSTVLGVISTHPGFVTNASDADGTTAADQRPLALSGRVPVKVSTENGPIAVGDYLTSSDIPGVAMKATGNGAVIGVAMANFDGSESDSTACGAGNTYMCGTVLFFINPSATNPANDTLQGGDAAFNSVVISGALTADSINVGGLATIASLTVTGDASFQGTVAISGDITLSAHLITTGPAPTVQTLTAAGSNGASTTVDGNDISGTITVTTGTTNATLGDLLKLTFAKAYTQAPHVMITPDDAASAQLLVYASSITAGSFNLSAAAQPQAGTTYTFTYYVVQ